VAEAGVQYRQGDLLLVAVAELPPGLEPLPLPAGEVLALVPADAGGAGTHGVLAGPGLRAWRTAGRDGPAEWLEIRGGRLTLAHPEHAPLVLEPGLWQIRRQRRYDPGQHQRWVAD